MAARPIVLLVHLQCEASPPSYPSPYPSRIHLPPSTSRLPLPSRLRPLVFDHLSVTVDPSKPVHLLHSLIERTYSHLVDQTADVDADAPSPPSSAHLYPTSTAPLSAHHVRVLVVLKERLYAVSRLNLIEDALRDGESVTAVVRVKEGRLPVAADPHAGTEQQQQADVRRPAMENGDAADVALPQPPQTPAVASGEVKEAEEESSGRRSSRAEEAIPTGVVEEKRGSTAVSGETTDAATSHIHTNGGSLVDTEERKEPPRGQDNAVGTVESAAPEPQASSAALTFKRPSTSAPATSSLSASAPPPAPPKSAAAVVPRRLPAALTSIECVLCGKGDGALKRTKEGAWCHLVCAKWSAGSEFDWKSQLVVGAPRALKLAAKRSCRLCKRPKKTSAPLQCGEDDCPVNFHLTCGQRHGLQTAHVDFVDTGLSELVAYCEKHAKVELMEWQDDGCCVCVFMRPDAKEQSRKLQCTTCGMQVHKTCYYGRDEELMSDEEAAGREEKEGEEQDGGFDWDHWKCMRCEWVEDHVYRFPRQRAAATKRKAKRKNGQTESGEAERKEEDETALITAAPHSPSESPYVLRGEWQLKKPRGRRRAVAEIEAKEEKQNQPQVEAPRAVPSSSATMALPPAPVRAAAASSTAPRSPPSKRKGKRQKTTANATVTAPPPTSAPSAPSASAAPSDPSASPNTNIRYLSDTRPSAPPTASADELRSPQTVLKALKNSSRSSSPTAAARAEYTTRVGELDVGAMRAILRRHGLSEVGSRSELIARLQASMVPLPEQREEVKAPPASILPSAHLALAGFAPPTSTQALAQRAQAEAKVESKAGGAEMDDIEIHSVSPDEAEAEVDDIEEEVEERGQAAAKPRRAQSIGKREGKKRGQRGVAEQNGRGRGGGGGGVPKPRGGGRGRGRVAGF